MALQPLTRSEHALIRRVMNDTDIIGAIRMSRNAYNRELSTLEEEGKIFIEEKERYLQHFDMTMTMFSKTLRFYTVWCRLARIRMVLVVAGFLLVPLLVVALVRLNYAWDALAACQGLLP
jgi:hypothetical protein